MSEDKLRDLRGFGTVEKWVLTNPNINVGAKGLYALLCAYAGNKDNAFPGTELLTYQLNISKNTLQKYLRDLKENKCIEVTQIRKGGKFDSNLYTLLPLAEHQNLVNQKTINQKTVNQELDTNNNSIKDKQNIIKTDNKEIEEVVSKYNSIPDLSNIVKVTDKRKKALNARIKDTSIEDVFKVLDIVATSDFLKGNNNRNWKCDFDWIMNPNNFVKILEGRYGTIKEIKSETPKPQQKAPESSVSNNIFDIGIDY